jgi:hypothetical protein
MLLIMKGFYSTVSFQSKVKVPEYIFDLLFYVSLSISIFSLLNSNLVIESKMIVSAVIGSCIALALIGLLLALCRDFSSQNACVDSDAIKIDFRYYSVVCVAIIILSATLQNLLT